MTTTAEAPRLYPPFRYRDPAGMIDFLEKAFGFAVRARYGEGDRVDHSELAFGSAMIMLGGTRDDEFGSFVGSPDGNAGKSVYIAVDDADAAFARAKAAGAEILREPFDTSYGSRDFICADPEGVVWCFGTYWPKASDPA